MPLLDTFTRQKIERKVDDVFKNVRKAQTPEEVVPLLVELSDFIDSENLTPQQLDEIRGMGYNIIQRHNQMEFLNNFGALISLVTASMIAGGAITAMYLMYITGGISSLAIVLLVPLVLLPLYLLYYGKRQEWFN